MKNSRPIKTNYIILNDVTLLIVTALLLLTISCSSAKKQNDATEGNDLMLNQIENDWRVNDTGTDKTVKKKTPVPDDFDDKDFEQPAEVASSPPAPGQEAPQDLAPIPEQTPLQTTEEAQPPQPQQSPPATPNKYFTVSENSLIFATKRGPIETLKYLLSTGININFQNSRGETALMVAAKYGRVEILIFLLENGADINLKNLSGKKAIELIGNKNSKQIRDILKNYH